MMTVAVWSVILLYEAALHSAQDRQTSYRGSGKVYIGRILNSVFPKWPGGDTFTKVVTGTHRKRSHVSALEEQ